MLNQKNIDLNIILSFANHYENLYEKGEITEKQLDQVLSLLDKIEKLSRKELEERIESIFGD